MKTDQQKRSEHAAYMRQWTARKAKEQGRSLSPNPGRPANTANVLWEKVDKRGTNECWPWKGFRNAQGYGRTWINDRGYYAHRVIFDLVNQGRITLSAPKNMESTDFIRHSCDNPSCCNPAHLLLGTHADNMRDKAERGRAPDYSGDKGPRCLLTMEQANEMRRLAQYGLSSGELATVFGISKPSAKAIVAGRSYKVT